jgi:hypothetical protein
MIKRDAKIVAIDPTINIDSMHQENVSKKL